MPATTVKITTATNKKSTVSGASRRTGASIQRAIEKYAVVRRHNAKKSTVSAIMQDWLVPNNANVVIAKIINDHYI